MKNLSSILTVALIFVAVPAFAQTLAGDWMITDGMFAGEKVPKDALDSMSLKMTRNSFDAKSGETMSKGKLTNQASSQPPQLVFKIDSGTDVGREIKAIYEFKGSILKIAFSQSEEYPSGFDSTADNKILVLSYKSKAPVSARGRGRNRKREPLVLPDDIRGSGG